MLEELAATNLGLIESVSLELTPGLTVVTGETGTGKTLMLGALRLLKGENAPKGLIGPHGDALDVSAVMTISGAETVLRRSVSSGKSRAYINGSIATAGTMSEFVGSHIAIVGQHDQHTITSAAGIRALVDLKLDKGGRDDLEAYRTHWAAYVIVRAEAESLGGDIRALEREAEMLDFQVSEIDASGFADGDEEALRSTVAQLRSADELASEIDKALVDLGDEGAQARIESAVRAITRANAIDSSLGGASQHAVEINDRIGELLTDLVRYVSDLKPDTRALAATEERLALLGALKRKYGDTIDDILTFRKNASERSAELAALLSASVDIEQRLGTAHASVVTAGAVLSQAREVASGRICDEALDHLRDLGFNDPAMEVAIQTTEPSPSGTDTVTLMFASDASLQVAPVAAVASGGELSRLVLALTLAAGGAESAVVAFDEIDAGIGGTTALAMGRKLAALAGDRQVICVTHLPQVAAFGVSHLVVSREGTVTTVATITGDDRVVEIARMLAGLGDSDAGQRHASELLTMAASSSA
jgi:DNA repair protein RecN (Recombination protein N)